MTIEVKNAVNIIKEYLALDKDIEGNEYLDSLRVIAQDLESQPNRCDSCTHSEEQDGSNCYECVKGIADNFEAQSTLDTRQRERQLEMEYQHGYDKGWEEGRKALEQQPRWIPISERLPKLGEVVLIYDKAFGYLTAIYSEVVDDYDERIPCFSTHYSISSDKWAIMHPIAWMPLPQPYKPERENTE